MKMLLWPLLPLLLGAPADSPSCEDFYEVLQHVPHQTLTLRTGVHESVWDGRPYPGCEVDFVTHDDLLEGASVPPLDAVEGSELHRGGWRTNPAHAADGPGTGLFAVERASVLCLVSSEQPAHVDEVGEIVQSETLRIRIQCRKR